MKSAARLNALAILLLVAVVVLSSAYWWRMSFDTNQLRANTIEQASKRATQLADLQAQHIEALLLGIDQSLHQFRDALQAENQASAELIAKNVFKAFPTNAIVHLSRIDAKGYFAYSTIHLPQPVYVGDRDYFGFHKKQHGKDLLYINKPIFSRTAHKWVILVTRPITKLGRFDGAAFISLSPEYFSQMLAKLEMGPKDISALMHTDGSFMARSQDLQGALGKSVDLARPLFHPDANTQGLFRANGTSDNVQRLYAWQKLQGYPLIIAIGLDEKTLLDPVDEAIFLTKMRSALGIGFLLLLTALVSFLLSRSSRQQRLLEQSEARLDELAQLSHTFAWEVNADGLYTYASHVVKDVLGYTPEELVGKMYFYDLHPKDGREAFKLSALGIFARKEPFINWGNAAETKDGNPVWLSTNGVPMLNSDGVLLGYRGSDTDITERKLFENELSNSRQLLQTIIDAAPLRIFWKNSNLKYMGCNPAFAKDAGENNPDEVIGKDDYQMGWAEQADLYRTDDLSVMSSGIPKLHYEEPQSTHDGQTIWLSTSKVPIKNTQNETIGILGIYTDITERKNLDKELQQKELYQRALLDNFPFNVWLKDSQSQFLAVNKSFASSFGWPSPESLVGKTDLDIATQELAEKYRADDRAVLAQGIPKNVEEIIEANGNLIWVETYKSPLTIDGRLVGTVGFSRDISERKQVELALLESEDRFRTISDSAQDAIVMMDAEGSISFWNPAAESIFGYTKDEAIGKDLHQLLAPQKYHAALKEGFSRFQASGQGAAVGRKLELEAVRKDGVEISIELSLSAVRRNDQWIAISIVRDITERRFQDTELKRIAYYDALTNLPNRVLLSDRLHLAMAQARRRGQHLAVAYLDLDNFKPINDRYGHSVGDQMLMTLATHMKQVLREGDTLARLGGDEFVAVLLDQANSDTSASIFNRLLAAVAQPTQVGNLVLQVSASIGITFYPQVDEMDADHLLRQADQAMYQAKLSGKNRYHVFDAEQDRSVRGHREGLERIRSALTEREFLLHYQPKVDLVNGEVAGAEALIRWQHPQKGLLSPGAFLHYLNGSDLEIEVGEWVIESVLQQIEVWNAKGISLVVSANISADHLLHTEFSERLRLALERHPKVAPNTLELEILETAAMYDMTQAVGALTRCRELGVQISLDDFGTGYSSLSYLRNLPVHTLKIDQSFVRDMLNDPADLGIVVSVVQLAQTFNRAVIAEGVETMEQGAMLVHLGCRFMQGYGIGRPMPADQITDWIRQWHENAIWRTLNDNTSHLLD